MRTIQQVISMSLLKMFTVRHFLSGEGGVGMFEVCLIVEKEYLFSHILQST